MNWRPLLNPSNPKLFFKKSDPKDLRLGEIVTRWNGEVETKGLLSGHKAAILGWPDDRGVSLNKGRPGAAQGPDAIRKALYTCTPGCNGIVKPNEILDLGNLTMDDELETCHENAAKIVRDITKTGTTLVTLGGGNDYAFSDGLGVAQAIGKGKTFGAINIDAHFDVRDVSHGPSSGTPYFRLLEHPDKVLQGENFVEFAIQPQRVSPAHHNYVKEKGAQIVLLDAIQTRGAKKLFYESLSRLRQSCDAIMVSLDIDSVRQADAPGCSAPSPNGLSAGDAEEIARIAGNEPKVKLYSVYEVAPNFDRDDQTSKLAASTVWFFLTSNLRLN